MAQKLKGTFLAVAVSMVKTTFNQVGTQTWTHIYVKSRSAYRVTFLPIMCAFGKNLDFVTEWLDFPDYRCNRKSIVDLHKRIFFQADFGWFFVIKMRFERKDKNNPDRCYITESNTGRDKM